MKDSKAHIIKYVLLGFAITALLVFIKIAVEHTSWGHRTEQWAFELLQGQLSPFNPDKDLPIVVVDISNIREGANDSVIDFVKLKEVVSAIANEKPSAIGIDVVLTLDEINYENADVETVKKFAEQTQEYVDFLDTCLALRDKGVPVFIGINEKTSSNPAEWLGEEKYKKLAASVLIKKGDTSRIPIWFLQKPNSERLYSLNALMANAYGKVHLPSSLSWAIEAEEDFPATKRHLEGDAEYADALVNYSKLEVIRQNKLLTVNQNSIKESSEKFRNRMVILGDDTKATDKFVIAGRNEAVPGVYLHASAAYTFVREPMYEFKFWVRLVLDFFLSGLIIVWVAVKRHQYLDKVEEFNWHKLQSWLGGIAFVLILLTAIALVRFFGVLWLDFILVAIFLWLHPTAEKLFTTIFIRK